MKIPYSIQIITCFFFLLSCSSESPRIDGQQFESLDLFDEEPAKLLSMHDTLIANETFRIERYDNDELLILNQRDSILLTASAQGVLDTEFIDFDEDGFLDIKLNLVTNVPSISNLALFNPATRSFEWVKDFDFFPAAQKIKNTSFYYSYSPSGCADLDWESELFLMKNYTITTLGKMVVTGCEDNAFIGVKIYKCNPDYDSLVKTVYGEPGYNEGKFEFIETYWQSNYQLFRQVDGLHHY